MTLPDERVRAVKNVRMFLYELMDPKRTPRVPREIRLRASQLAKHYPGDLYLNDIFSDYHKRDKAKKR